MLAAQRLMVAFVVVLFVAVSVVSVSFAADISPVRGTGTVTSVNQPGNYDFDTYKVKSGDSVSYATWAPNKDVKVGNSWWAKGQKYDMFLMNSKEMEGTQVFIAWSSQEDGYLWKVDDVINALGVGVENSVKTGDHVQIRWQDTIGKAGYLDVTLDVFRGNNPVASLSFTTKNPY